MSRGLARLLAGAAAVGVGLGLLEGSVVVARTSFAFPSAWHLRTFLVGAMALDAILAAASAALLSLILPAGRALAFVAGVGTLATLTSILCVSRGEALALAATGGRLAVAALGAAAVVAGVGRIPVALEAPPARHGRLALAALVAALAVAIWPLRLPRPSGRGPDVLLVVVDTLRADALGCYGSDATTPHVDRLARRGATFEDVATASNSTPSAIASLLTGTFVRAHGVRGFQYLLPDGLRVLAEEFLGAGYRTFGFSASFPAHLAYHRFDRGLEYCDDTSVPRPRWAPPVEALEQLAAFSLPELLGRRLLPRAKLASTREADVVTDEVLSFASWDRASPYFGVVHYFDPHAPYDPPVAFRQYHGKNIARGDLDGRFAAAGQAKPSWLEAVRDAQLPVSAYRGEVVFLDVEVGRLLAGLGRGVAGGAPGIVALTADHGENLLEHGDGMLFNHDGLYQTQVQVPLLIAGSPAPAGSSVRPLVRSVDLFPTLTELAGLPAPRGIDGRSVVTLLGGGTLPGVIAPSQAPHHPIYAWRRGPMKLLRNRAGGPCALYDLAADPAERHDLAGSLPGELASLTAELEDFLATDPHEAATREMGAADREHLETLGYLGAGQASAASAPELLCGAGTEGTR